MLIQRFYHLTFLYRAKCILLSKVPFTCSEASGFGSRLRQAVSADPAPHSKEALEWDSHPRFASLDSSSLQRQDAERQEKALCPRTGSLSLASEEALLLL